MPSIVFVHGIGVRDEAYPGIWPHLRAGLERTHPGMPAEFCFWGGEHGARLVTATAPEPGDPQAELWAATFEDPVWALVALLERAAQEPAPVSVPGRVPHGAWLRERLIELGDTADVLQDRELDAHLPAAVKDLLAMPVTNDCLSRAEAVGTELPVALSQALVVLTVTRAGGDQPPVLAPGTLDRLHDVLSTALGGRPMARFSWLWTLAARLLRPPARAGLYPVSWAMAMGREPLLRHFTPYLGDVLVYLSRGEAIRDEIIHTVERQAGPVHLIAHSLGGIACFDLLAHGRLPTVQTLVTVGTQVAYLRQIDALPGLRRDGALPPLPEWVNVYDRQDALSFPAQPAFGAAVRDERLDSGLPFPLAHNAYFRNDSFYRLLADVIE